MIAGLSLARLLADLAVSALGSPARVAAGEFVAVRVFRHPKDTAARAHPAMTILSSLGIMHSPSVIAECTPCAGKKLCRESVVEPIGQHALSAWDWSAPGR